MLSAHCTHGFPPHDTLPGSGSAFHSGFLRWCLFCCPAMPVQRSTVHTGWLPGRGSAYGSRSGPAEAFFSIIIICVDHNERGIDHALCCKHSLTRSPRLCPACRKFSRNIVNILESVVHSYIMRSAMEAIRSPMTSLNSFSISLRIINTT